MNKPYFIQINDNEFVNLDNVVEIYFTGDGAQGRVVTVDGKELVVPNGYLGKLNAALDCVVEVPNRIAARKEAGI